MVLASLNAQARSGLRWLLVREGLLFPVGNLEVLLLVIPEDVLCVVFVVGRHD
jgi:hypothetical protein